MIGVMIILALFVGCPIGIVCGIYYMKRYNKNIIKSYDKNKVIKVVDVAPKYLQIPKKKKRKSRSGIKLKRSLA